MTDRAIRAPLAEGDNSSSYTVQEILMPALFSDSEKATLAKWLVKEGDVVSAGDLVAEIETEKATVEFESDAGGVIGKLLIPEGTEGVKVGTPIAVLMGDGNRKTYTVKAWRVKLGDFVEEGDPVCDLSFDGGVVTVNSPAKGDIQNINRIEGQQAEAGYAIGVIGCGEDKRALSKDIEPAPQQKRGQSIFRSLSMFALKGLFDLFVLFLITLLFLSPLYLSMAFLAFIWERSWLLTPLTVYLLIYSFLFVGLLLELMDSGRLGGIPVLRSNFFLPLSSLGITNGEVVTWQDAKKVIKVSFLFATVIVAGIYWFIYRDVTLNKAFYTFSTGGRATAQIERVEGFEFSVMSCEGVATALSGDSYTFVFDRILWNSSQLSNGNWTVQCFGTCLLVNESEMTEEHISIPVRGVERELSFLSAAQRIRRHCEDEHFAAAAGLRGAD